MNALPAIRPSALLVSILGLLAAPGSTLAGDLDAEIGARLFKRAWVPAPTATKADDGLGPHFDARSCAACHPGAGRASRRLADDGEPREPGLVIRLDRHGAGDPVYGRQLQTGAVAGVAAEARPRLAALPAGEGMRWRVDPGALGYGPLSDETRVSVRAAPALHGLGLLAAVAEGEILTRADPDDRDGDGISGRAARIDGKLGRFGQKATGVAIVDQVAGAFSLDMGLSTPARPAASGDCTATQVDCLGAPSGSDAGGPEIDAEIVRLIGHFVATLPAPTPQSSSRREPGQAGARLFAAIGCAACHAPALAGPAGQPVAAFTDLLLHDLGPGLADAAEGDANAAEWRTAPLWGISSALKRGAGLLHDGRARTVAEAIGWHDGEARRARTGFDGLTVTDRKALIAFIERL
ncbi:MAG: hypothetical protein JNM13_00745 [Hyphomicrobiaceae bacterium]|nr:hypothetical protein [Hyphomicrobiaceae bacterium]